MRNHVTHIGAAVLTAALAVACSGRTDQVGNERQAQSGGTRGTSEYVKLDGCVQPASSANGEFVLREVALANPAEQPSGQEQMAHRLPIENGSWVRLIGNEDVKNYLGKRVEIMGHVEDTGQNTLGTTGRTASAQGGESNDQKFKQSSKDAHTDPNRNMAPTTAAPARADANGTAPLIAVERISKLSETCSGPANNPGPAR